MIINLGKKYLPYKSENMFFFWDKVDNEGFFKPKKSFDFIEWNTYLLFNFIKNDVFESIQWIVYCHINKINNKKYIGITHYIDNLNIRFRNGNGYKDNDYFYKAIKKNTWKNFETIILKSNIFSLKEAQKWEAYFIDYYNTTNKNFGYNILSYDNNLNRLLNEKTKEKIRKKAKRKRNYTNETIKKLSEAGKKSWKNLTKKEYNIRCKKISKRFKNVKKSKEHRNKLSENKKKNKQWVGESNPRVLNPLIGKNNPMFGKKQTYKTKKLIGSINREINIKKACIKYNFNFFEALLKVFKCKNCNKEIKHIYRILLYRIKNNINLSICRNCLNSENSKKKTIKRNNKGQYCKKC